MPKIPHIPNEDVIERQGAKYTKAETLKETKRDTVIPHAIRRDLENIASSKLNCPWLSYLGDLGDLALKFFSINRSVHPRKRAPSWNSVHRPVPFPEGGNATGGTLPHDQ